MTDTPDHLLPNGGTWVHPPLASAHCASCDATTTDLDGPYITLAHADGCPAAGTTIRNPYPKGPAMPDWPFDKTEMMPTPLTPDEVDDLRVAHMPVARGAAGIQCRTCNTWPCTVARLLATLDHDRDVLTSHGIATPAARADEVRPPADIGTDPPPVPKPIWQTIRAAHDALEVRRPDGTPAVDRVRSTHGHQSAPNEWLDGGTINIGQAPPDLHPAVRELRQTLDLHARMIDQLLGHARAVDLPGWPAPPLAPDAATIDAWETYRRG